MICCLGHLWQRGWFWGVRLLSRSLDHEVVLAEWALDGDDGRGKERATSRSNRPETLATVPGPPAIRPILQMMQRMMQPIWRWPSSRRRFPAPPDLGLTATLAFAQTSVAVRDPLNGKSFYRRGVVHTGYGSDVIRHPRIENRSFA